MSAVLCNEPCKCGGTLPMMEGKGGTLSGKCNSCGAQKWVRSPAGVAKWRALLGQSGGDPAPAKSKAAGGGLLL